MKKGPPRAPPNGPDCTISKRGCQAKKEKKFRAQAADLARFLNRAKVEGLARKLTGGTWHDSCRAGSMPRHRIRPPRTLFSKKSSLFGKLAHFYCPNGAFLRIANRVQMPMNNDNVTGAAVGVAEGVSDSKGNDNESIAVLGMFRGGVGGRIGGRIGGRGRRGQAGRQAGGAGRAGGRQAGPGAGRQAGRRGQETKRPPACAGGRERGREKVSPSPL